MKLIIPLLQMTWYLCIVIPAVLLTAALRSVPPLLVRLSRPAWLTPLVALSYSSYCVWYFANVGDLVAFLFWGFLASISYLGLGLGLLTTAAKRGWYHSHLVTSLHARAVESEAADFALLALYPIFFTCRTIVRVGKSGVTVAKRRAPGLRTLNSKLTIARARRKGGDYLIGIEQVGNQDRGVALTDGEVVRHTLLLGATGSGKTTTMRGLIFDAISTGRGVVLIDLKGDPALARSLKDAAATAGRTFAQFSLTPSERKDYWNPLLAGDPTTRRDKLVALSEWTEPYYKTTCERFAQLAFAAYEAVGTTPQIADLVAMLDDPHVLETVAHEMPDPAARDVLLRYVDAVCSDRSQRNALSGFASRIGTLVDPAGPLNFGSELPTTEIDLGAQLASNGVTVFSLNSARGQASAAQLAALALLDTLSAVGDRIAAENTSTALVAIDEFSAIDGDHVLGLLARARSAGIGVVLSTQELADLARVDEHFTEQVLGNTATKIIHRQDVPDSAELIARIAGTSEVIKPTYQLDSTGVQGLRGQTLTGMGSARPVEEFMVHPNLIKRLTTGEAIVIRKEPQFSVHLVRVISRDTSTRNGENATSHTSEISASTPEPRLSLPMPDSATDHPGSRPAPSEARTWLDVPFEEKDDAKRSGARWDANAKRWYAPQGRTPELAPWTPREPLPSEIAGEDRSYGSGLFVDLVPETAWYSNVRAVLTPSSWKRLSRMVRERAGWTCEACGVGATSGEPRMDCHERWTFDEGTSTQRLVRLVSLCQDCHEVTHFGYASTQGRGDAARQHFARVTGWTLDQVDVEIGAAFDLWERRSMQRWTLDVSILDGLDLDVADDYRDGRAAS